MSPPDWSYRFVFKWLVIKILSKMTRSNVEFKYLSNIIHKNCLHVRCLIFFSNIFSKCRRKRRGFLLKKKMYFTSKNDIISAFYGNPRCYQFSGWLYNCFRYLCGGSSKGQRPYAYTWTCKNFNGFINSMYFMYIRDKEFSYR